MAPPGFCSNARSRSASLYHHLLLRKSMSSSSSRCWCFWKSQREFGSPPSPCNHLFLKATLHVIFGIYRSLYCFSISLQTVKARIASVVIRHCLCIIQPYSWTSANPLYDICTSLWPKYTQLGLKMGYTMVYPVSWPFGAFYNHRCTPIAGWVISWKIPI